MLQQAEDKQSHKREKVSEMWPSNKETFYRHYKGGTYILLANGTLESNLEPMVIYRRTDNTRIWIRPVSEFHGVVTRDGRAIKRFEPINGDLNV